MNDLALRPFMLSPPCGSPCAGSLVGSPSLSPEVADYLRAPLSDNSRRAYRADLAQFLTWGGSIPATPELVAGYLAAHAGKNAMATFGRRLVSIAKAHTA